jgi:hypothetical protein
VLAIFVVLYTLYAMKAYNGSRGIIPLILSLRSGWRRLVNFMTRRSTQVSIKWEAVSPRVSLDVLEKRNLLYLLRFKPQTVQLVAGSLY